MKSVLFVIISTVVLFCAQAFGSATCSQSTFGGKASVVVNDNTSITVNGLTSKGIKSGIYNCVVQMVTTAWLATQSRAICQLSTNSLVTVNAWFIQGMSAVGTAAASVALYDKSGHKVFESGCSRN